jgi:putative PIN family toxin of toxin-antitoxin system
MNPPSWVLDTNVIVSGVLNPHGYPGRLVDAIIAGTLQLTLDDRILTEYREVLARSKFGISRAQLEAIFSLFLNQDLVTPEPLIIDLPDPDDLPFLGAAQPATDKTIVTGNAKHFPKPKRRGTTILSPAQAWQKLCSGC